MKYARFVKVSNQYNSVRSQKFKNNGLDPNNVDLDGKKKKKKKKDVSFMEMIKKAKAEAMLAMDADLGIMGSVVPIRTMTPWHQSIDDDPLAVLYHVGYAHDGKTMSKRKSLKNMVRLSSPDALAAHNKRYEEKKAKKLADEEAAYQQRMVALAKKREEGAGAGSKVDDGESEGGESKGESKGDETKKADDDEDEDFTEDSAATEVKTTTFIPEKLLPEGTTKFIHEKTKEWSVSVQTLRQAVRDLGIRHITEKQYEAIEASNFFDFTTFVPLARDHEEKVTTQG